MPALDLSQSAQHIGHACETFIDPDHRFTFDQITDIPDSLYHPVKTDISSHLFSSATIYFKFRVINRQSRPVKRVLLFSTAWLDHIQVKIVGPSGQATDLLTGNLYPFSQRAMKSIYPNVMHEFAPGQSSIYIEVTTRDPFIVPISVLKPADLYQQQAKDQSFKTFIYGIITAMILYHLILFLSIRLKYYAYYVLYLAAFLLMNASYNGYTYELFLGDYPTLQNWLQSTGIFLFTIAGLFFAKSFLNLDKYAPAAQKSTDYLILFFIFTLFFSALFGYHVHVITSIALSVIFSLYVFWLSVLSLMKGNTSARFFLLGTTAGLIGTAITALTVMAILPYTHLGYQAVEFGLAIDSILLSFALVDRVKASEREKKLAESFANTDALTLLPNRRAYNLLCEQERELAHTIYREYFTAMMIDIDYFKTVNDSYGHAFGDDVLRQVAKLLLSSIKSTDYIYRMGGEEFLILLPDTPADQAQEIAERIRAKAEVMDIFIEETVINITLSVGISDRPVDNKTIEIAANAADKALYKAKQSGRNRVVTFRQLSTQS